MEHYLAYTVKTNNAVHVKNILHKKVNFDNKIMNIFDLRDLIIRVFITVLVFYSPHLKNVPLKFCENPSGICKL
jgi:hypothetical protein